MSKALVITSYPYEADPRHAWWVQSCLSQGLHVDVVDVFSRRRRNRDSRFFAPSESTLGHPRSEHVSVRHAGMRFPSAARHVGQSILRRPGLAPHAKALGVWGILSRAVAVRPSYSLWIAREMVNSLAALDTCPGLELRRYSVVIANDLPAAFAACLLTGTKTQVVYDCQEFFPELYRLLAPPMGDVEFGFWSSFETEVMHTANLVVVVSPGQADYVRRYRGVQSVCRPNLPLSSDRVDNRAAASGPVRFVFMGHAQPHRGLDALVASWRVPSEVATLDLFLARNSYRQRIVDAAERQGRAFPRVGLTVMEPVPPTDMVRALSRYDVGVIPYAYDWPYSEASPNKFGDYLAAGLAVLSTAMPFVASMIESRGLGRIFVWSREDSFAEASRDLCRREVLAHVKTNAREAFADSMHWEATEHEFWSRLAAVRQDPGQHMTPLTSRVQRQRSIHGTTPIPTLLSLRAASSDLVVRSLDIGRLLASRARWSQALLSSIRSSLAQRGT